jgi:hypothetical protein
MLCLAADENFNNNIIRDRILLTHDVSTITKYAYEWIEAGQAMPGVFEVKRTAPIGQVIEDILLLVECSLDSEWDGQIIYLPLK